MSELSESQLSALRRSFEKTYDESLDRHSGFPDQYRSNGTQRIWLVYLMGAVNMLDLLSTQISQEKTA